MMKFFNYFLLFSIFFLPIENADAGRSKLLLDGFDFFVGNSIRRITVPSRITQRQFTSFQKSFFSTTRKETPQIEREEMTDKTMKKKLQIVDVGKKDYKFDPKTSMYYYEDKGSKELKGLKQPELKEFETFVEFDVKKK